MPEWSNRTLGDIELYTISLRWDAYDQMSAALYLQAAIRFELAAIMWASHVPGLCEHYGVDPDHETARRTLRRALLSEAADLVELAVVSTEAGGADAALLYAQSRAQHSDLTPLWHAYKRFHAEAAAQRRETEPPDEPAPPLQRPPVA